MSQFIGLLLASTFAFAVAAEGPQAENESYSVVKPAFKLGFPPIAEMSGIVKSERFDDVYWVHNDSGDVPRLFAIDGNGQVIVPAFYEDTFHDETVEAGKKPWTGVMIEGAKNDDWGDIEIHNDIIYIADTGNNGYDRRNLGVYVIAEPNPYASRETKDVKFVPIRYPHQKDNPLLAFLLGDSSHDSEAMFIFGDKLYFLTKSRKPHEVGGKKLGTTLYRLDTKNPNEYNKLQLVDAHPDIHLPTGADLSPDGQRLAVLCYSQLWVFDRPSRGDRWLTDGRARMLPLSMKRTGGVEGITWQDNDTLLFGNEPGDFFTVKLDQIPLYH